MNLKQTAALVCILFSLMPVNDILPWRQRRGRSPHSERTLSPAVVTTMEIS